MADPAGGDAMQDLWQNGSPSTDIDEIYRSCEARRDSLSCNALLLLARCRFCSELARCGLACTWGVGDLRVATTRYGTSHSAGRDRSRGEYCK